MTTSDLILLLQESLREYGDLDVVINDMEPFTEDQVMSIPSSIIKGIRGYLHLGMWG